MEKSRTPGSKERVNFLLPGDLIRDARRVAGELDCSLTDLFKVSMARFLKEYDKASMAKELEHGYRANHAYYSRLNKEWEIADSE